jgi:hypothetical protein
MRLVVLAAGLGAVLVGACGGDDPRPGSRVQLAVSSPQDQAVVRAREVDVEGTVRPSTAEVIVGGSRATVSDGTFRGTVRLVAGTNVIDVMASADGARPALTAIRVRRMVSVRIPDLTGTPVDEARRRLTGLGLEVDVQERGGLFDRLLPGDPKVCDTDPEAGEERDPGTTVTVAVSRRC